MKGQDKPQPPLEGFDATYARALYRPMGFTDADFRKPLVAIVNSWSELAAGHAHLRRLSAAVREGIAAAGGMPVEFNAICDGICQGPGMHYILPSREIIAYSAELMLKAHRFQGAVMISSCDKITPGFLMAAAWCDLPTVFLTGGYMPQTRLAGRSIGTSDVKEAMGRFRAGRISEQELYEIEARTCRTTGICNMMGTANTMAAVVEALGLSLPGNATTTAAGPAIDELARSAGERAVALVREGRRFLDMLTPASLENAIRAAIAIGGSTNMVIHLLALAEAASLKLTLDDFDLLNKLNDQNPSAEERNNLVECLNQLLDLMDAASDLLLSEAVYQVARGNMERAGAALAALDRQERPVEPEIVRTPRSGYGYQQRLLALINETALPGTWAGFPLDPRARAEPRLNAWVARLVGDPARFRLAAQLTTILPDGTQKVNPNPLVATLRELNLSPLSLAMLTASGGAGQPSEMEERLANLFAKKAAVPAGTQAELELLNQPPKGATAQIAGLGALRTLLDWARDLITTARFADGRDLSLPHELAAPGINLSDLRTRADQAVVAQETALKNLDAAVKLTNPTRAALLAALEGASRAGAQAAVPRFVQAGGASNKEELKALTDQAKTVLAAMTAARERRKASEKAFNDAALNQPPELLAAAAHQIERLRSIFGAGFPVLPVFSAPNATELAASLANRAALLGGDELAPLAVLQRLALARPLADKLLSVISASELLGASLPAASWQVIQLPHTPGERWAGLPFTGGQPPSAQVAILAFGPFNPARPAAGLAIDAWSELVPFNNETTAVAFHYDTPGARPPQAILLATPPDLSQQTWTFEALVATILEALDLARLRMVGPKQLPILGGPLLPAAYLPNNFSKDVASVNFFTLLEKYPALLEATKIMGR